MIKSYYRIVFIYLIFASLWVYFSDVMVGLLFSSADGIIWAQNFKGVAFVAATSILLLLMLRADCYRFEQLNQKLRKSYDQTLQGWVQLMDARQKETGEHSLRVTRMTVKLASLMGIEGDELTHIARGALLHDAGKVGVPDSVLIKAGSLDAEELAVMQQHPVIARNLMQDIEFLRPSMDIPYSHHERWDGSGYPQGLQGEAIPLAARLFMVIDVYDALLEKRVYKEAWSEERVLSYIAEHENVLFDPQVVKLFLNHYPAIKETAHHPSVF